MGQHISIVHPTNPMLDTWAYVPDESDIRKAAEALVEKESGQAPTTPDDRDWKELWAEECGRADEAELVAAEYREALYAIANPRRWDNRRRWMRQRAAFTLKDHNA